MIYSVWDHATRRYSYFQTLEQSAAVNAPAPKHLAGMGDDLGLSPEEAAWPLPSDAVKVGEGIAAKGMIASSASVGHKAGKPLIYFGLGLALAYLWR